MSDSKKIFTRMCINNWGGISHKVLQFNEYVNLFSGKSGSGKSTVMDAAASAYLEEYCDRYEETLGFDNRTYRACPGYGDFPLEFNKRIAILLDIPRKIGVTITPNNLLIPQKSMLGLIGIGSDKRKKSCGNCVMKEDCPFRKRGQRCYRTD